VSLNKETYGTTQRKMVQPGNGRHREEEEKLVRNWKGTIVGTKRLETFCSLT
jgi:hypothetical protein